MPNRGPKEGDQLVQIYVRWEAVPATFISMPIDGYKPIFISRGVPLYKGKSSYSVRVVSLFNRDHKSWPGPTLAIAKFAICEYFKKMAKENSKVANRNILKIFQNIR